MDVRCDRCQTEYELDDASVKDSGTSVQCTTCGHTFIIARRPSSPINQVPLSPTPPGGNSETTGPDVPEWTLSTDDGKVHRFRDLNTLQKWIVERKVTRADRMSRSGGPWLALGDMTELGPFFSVVDEADRARATTPSPPRVGPPPVRFPTPSPSSPSPSGPLAITGPPPPPAQARRPVSEDGPTVPNRRLAEMGAAAAGARSPTRTPGVGGGAQGTPGPVGGSGPIAGAARATGSGPGRGSGSGSARAAGGTPPPQPFARPAARTEIVSGPDLSGDSRGIDTDFLVPNHRARNITMGLVVLALAGVGGYWLWAEQGRSKTLAAATPTAAKSDAEANSATAPAVPAAGPVAAVPAAGAEPAPATGSGVGGGRGASAPPTAATAGGPTPAPTAGAAVAGPPGRAARGAADAGTGKSSGGAASYDRLVADGDRMMERGQAAKADKLYGQALAARPDGFAALTGAGYVLLERQRHFKAIETFRRALDVQPTYGPALFGIAESYRARGDLGQALGAYRQYLSIAPTGTDAPAARRQVKELESAGTTVGAGTAPGASGTRAAGSSDGQRSAQESATKSDE